MLHQLRINRFATSDVDAGLVIVDVVVQNNKNRYWCFPDSSDQMTIMET